MRVRGNYNHHENNQKKVCEICACFDYYKKSVAIEYFDKRMMFKIMMVHALFLNYYIYLLLSIIIFIQQSANTAKRFTSTKTYLFYQQ